MKFKSFVAAAVIAVSASSSFATTTPSSPYNIGNLTTLVDEGYSQVVNFGVGSFNDVFNFDISGGINAFSGIASKLSIKPTQVIESFAGTLTGPGSFSQSFSLSSLSTVGSTLQALGYDGNLASGAYSLTLTGTAQAKGSYSVALLAAAPVPEPETYSMLLAGLGLMGAIVRRRNKAGAA